MVFLIGGSLSDLAIPLFIGRVIDLLQKGDFDGVGELCLYMLIVIFVSNSNYSFPRYKRVFVNSPFFRFQCRFQEFVSVCAQPFSIS